MSSAGSIMAMIQSLRNNRNLLKKRRYFDEAKKEFGAYKETSHLNKKATPEQLEAIRVKAKEKRKRAIKIGVIAFIVSLLVTIVLAVLFLNLISE